MSVSLVNLACMPRSQHQLTRASNAELLIRSADINYCLEIDPPSNETYLSSPAFSLKSTEFTFALWADFLSYGTSASLVSQSDSGAEYLVFGLKSFNTTDDVTMTWKFNATDSGIVLVCGNNENTCNIAKWNHWVGVVRRSASGGWERRIWVNGSPATTWLPCAAYEGTGPLRFGTGSLGAAHVRLDNLALWIGRALSGTDVENLWEKDQGWFEWNPSDRHRNLAIFYRFHEQPAWPYYTESPSYGYGVFAECNFLPNTSIISDLSGGFRFPCVFSLPSSSSLPPPFPSFHPGSLSHAPARWA